MGIQHFDSHSICKLSAFFSLQYSGDFEEALLLFPARERGSLKAAGWINLYYF